LPCGPRQPGQSAPCGTGGKAGDASAADGLAAWLVGASPAISDRLPQPAISRATAHRPMHKKMKIVFLKAQNS
jgi:hypothetical protein